MGYTYYRYIVAVNLIGRQDGTFAIVFETSVELFYIVLYLLIWLVILVQKQQYSVTVRQPPDFDLIAQGIDDLSGDKYHAIIVGGRLLANILGS